MRVLAVAAVFLVPALTVVTDPKDAGGKLDLRSAKAVRNDPLLQLTISMYGPWVSRLLASGGNGLSGPKPGLNELTVLYDVNGDGAADFTGQIIYRGGLFLWITGKHSAFEPVPVKRPSPSSASFTHPVDVLFKGKGTKKLRFAITSVNGTHTDRLPNRGWVPVVFHLS